MITIYFDGSITKNPGGIARYGYVIYKDNKLLKKACSVIGKGKGMTVNVAEYAALKHAIEWFNEQDLDDEIIVKGDSMLVINQMKGIYRIKSDTSKYFVPKIKELLQDKKVNFIWIPREENEEADLCSRL